MGVAADAATPICLLTPSPLALLFSPVLESRVHFTRALTRL